MMRLVTAAGAAAVFAAAATLSVSGQAGAPALVITAYRHTVTSGTRSTSRSCAPLRARAVDKDSPSSTAAVA